MKAEIDRLPGQRNNLLVSFSRWFLLLVGLCGLSAAADTKAPSEHASVYRNPMNRFTLNVPVGWKTRSLDDGVQIVHGDSYASVMVFEHVSGPADLVEEVQSQIRKKWQRFEITNRGETELGEQRGSSLRAEGINPQGQEASIHLTGVLAGDVGYVLVTGFLKRDAKLADTLTEIENSFRLLDGARMTTATAQPTLGVEVTELSAEDAKAYRLDEPRGVLVLQIIAGGPAKKAGVNLHDLVLDVDGESIDSPASLQQLVRSHKAGDVVALHILRLGPDNKIQELTVQAKLEAAGTK